MSPDRTDDQERDNHGRFESDTSDDDVLQVIKESQFPAVTARWLADEFEIERQSAHHRLRSLNDSGKIERGKLSPRVVIWWISNETDE